MIIHDYWWLIINKHDYWLLIINHHDYWLLIINTHDGTTERRPDGAPKGRNVDFTKESQRESRKSRTTARRPTARRADGAGADPADILCNSTWMRLEPLHCAKGTLFGEWWSCMQWAIYLDLEISKALEPALALHSPASAHWQMLQF